MEVQSGHFDKPATNLLPEIFILQILQLNIIFTLHFKAITD